jgi:hypothetical protein
VTPIPTAVKIPTLLTQYFYSNQRLELPGIGIFTLDASSIQTLQTSKQRSAVLEGVRFENKPAVRESPELIAFIAEKSGKMKALAISDLDSYLQLAMQFLNMGKPFLFEGIGIVSKVKAGEFEFTPVSVSTDKIKEHHAHQATATAGPAGKEDTTGKYETFLSGPKTTFEWKRPVMAVMLLCGLGFAIWGGYVISQKNKKNKNAPQNTTAASQAIIVDTTQKVDSSTLIAQTNILRDSNYKYVLEIAKSKRAFRRYNQLKSINWKVQLETQDSVQYKLYMLLPSIDTTKTLDSLTVMTGKKVYIEYSN